MLDAKTLASLQDYALREIKHIERTLNQEMADLAAKLKPHGAPSPAEFVEHDRKQHAIQFAASNLGNLGNAPFSELPCPICFSRTTKLTPLTVEVHTDAGPSHHCDICKFNAIF